MERFADDPDRRSATRRHRRRTDWPPLGALGDAHLVDPPTFDAVLSGSMELFGREPIDLSLLLVATQPAADLMDPTGAVDLQAALRLTDVVTRFEDGTLAILVDADGGGALALAQRLEAAVRCAHPGHRIWIGGSTAPDTERRTARADLAEATRSALSRARAALAVAHRQAGGAIQLAPPDEPSGRIVDLTRTGDHDPSLAASVRAMSEWGPLEGLIGEWEGEGGLDRAYSHARSEVLDTPYLERVTMKPFGPVDNGRQRLFGLDYKTAMWRDSEENPFHTEVGYWLWDAAAGEVLRGFVVPRGITVLAGAIGVAADATSFELRAELGDPRYGISENTYLGANASSVAYRATITVYDDGTWGYDEDTTLRMAEFPDPFPHTDHNRLRRVG